MTTAAPYAAVGDKLKATAGVTALVGTTQGAPSIFSRRAPQSVRTRDATTTLFDAYIVIKKIQGEDVKHTINRRDLNRVSPMVVYCFAATHLAACSLADAVLTAIDSDATSQTGTQAWGSYSIDRCMITDRYDASTDPSLGDEIDFYCEAIELKLYHKC